MIKFERFILENGLRVLVNQDTSTTMVAVNILYNVGARDEHPENTGLAHLFEHLMFEGSVNISNFDYVLQRAGGESNAFTSNDITNYYLTIPAQNLETALWVESDRILGLGFSEEKLAIQKSVVAEEYRQSYLNQPYGDVWMLLRSLVYKVHPYMWPTIGKSLEHIEKIKMAHAREFFYRFYRPNNAVLVLAGNINPTKAFSLARKWFGEISPSLSFKRDLPIEPKQIEPRYQTVTRDVPFDEIYIAFPTCSRLDSEYYATDLISDILAGGRSSRLYENLVKKRKIFIETNAWITGSLDNGFFTIMGRLHKGNSINEAEQLLWSELEQLKNTLISDCELQKVKNKVEANNAFSEISVLSKAMNLAYFEIIGDAMMLNQENDKYFAVSQEQIKQAANELFQPRIASTLKYLARD